ncbi:hypothetical protein AAZX31_02G111500 [Glycine max]
MHMPFARKTRCSKLSKNQMPRPMAVVSRLSRSILRLGNNDNSGPINIWHFRMCYVPGLPSIKRGHLCPCRFYFLDLVEAMARSFSMC